VSLAGRVSEFAGVMGFFLALAAATSTAIEAGIRRAEAPGPPTRAATLWTYVWLGAALAAFTITIFLVGLRLGSAALLHVGFWQKRPLVSAFGLTWVILMPALAGWQVSHVVRGVRQRMRDKEQGI
jgi:hypothetical protein